MLKMVVVSPNVAVTGGVEALHQLRWQSGLPDAGHWDLKRRREFGWD